MTDNEKQLQNERDNLMSLFRQTPEMVCILRGPEHVFEFVNLAHIKVLGFDATGLAVKVAQPESVEIHGILDSVYATGVTAELREIPITVTGKLRYFNLTYSARRNADGEISGVMILGLEITDLIESRRAQLALDLALVESREHLQFALAGSNMGVWTVNLETGKVDLSREASEIFDAVEEFGSADLAIDAFIHPDDREHARGVFVEALASDKMYADEYRVLRKDGTIRWVSLRGRGLFKDGVPKLLSGVVMDVTERRQLEIEREKAIALRDEFISIASHELRTPMTTLSLQNQMLARVIEKNPAAQVDAARVRSVVETSQKQLKHLMRLVEDMLDVSKISSKGVTLHREVLSLSEITREVTERFTNILESQGVSLELDLDDSLEISADPLRLDQILTNLISNAIKYGNHKPVLVQTGKTSDSVLITIKDQGIGIAQDKLPLIFERFERAITSQNISGMGLGLFIVRQLAEAHGGTVEVTSSLGVGTTFTIKLPL